MHKSVLFFWTLAMATAFSADAFGQTLAKRSLVLQGQRKFLLRSACHVVTRNVTKVGPSRAGVFGRKAAAVPGYRYLPAMKGQKFAWNDATLDRYLTKPNAAVPGTSMTFAGVANPADHAAIIAYLKQHR